MAGSYKLLKTAKAGIVFIALVISFIVLTTTSIFDETLKNGLINKSFINLVVGFLAIAVLSFAYYQYLFLSSILYFIEDGLLRKREGVFTINESFLELYRVMDLHLSADVTGKVLGYYTVTLYSKDVSTPVMNIKGIEKGEDVSIVMRKEIEKARRKARIFETL